jgi:quercetin dioxygenase-like cupin family protein
LKTVRAGGLITRYAPLGDAVFVLVELPDSGSAGSMMEVPCRDAHWGLVLQGEFRLEGRRPRTFSSGTAFYVAPGPVHRFHASSRGVIAGFQPLSQPIDESPGALLARGFEIVSRLPAPAPPPTSMRVAGATRMTVAGQIETASAVMGEWLFTSTTYGPKSGFADGWCDLPHWGLVLDGTLVMHHDNGDLELLGPGDVFHCPPGAGGHRIEVADGAVAVDYTPIAAIEDPGLRRAPRMVAAGAALDSAGRRHRNGSRSAVPDQPDPATAR